MCDGWRPQTGARAETSQEASGRMTSSPNEAEKRKCNVSLHSFLSLISYGRIVKTNSTYRESLRKMPSNDQGASNDGGSEKRGPRATTTTTTTTHQMNILGQDGEDLLQLHAAASSSQSKSAPSTSALNSQTKKSTASASTKQQKRGRNSNSPSSSNSVTFSATAKSAEADNKWWGKITGLSNNGGSSSDDKNVGGTEYQSLEAPSEKPSGAMGFFSSTTTTSPTVEDQLRQDCSFFYQGLEDGVALSNNSTPRKMRTASSHHGLNHRQTRFLSGRDGAMFHAKYQQLNQELILDDDLALDDDDDDHPSQNRSFREDEGSSQNFSDVQKSTLVYEQDGRILVKLPRDQVRLVVDHDLEAGIVSVEQWRQIDQGDIAKESVFDDSKPDLRYVLTVPEDLYRRVVSEMSDAMVPPYFGAFKCCSENEKADIRIALAVLCVVFILMFISTLEWPTE